MPKTPRTLSFFGITSHKGDYVNLNCSKYIPKYVGKHLVLENECLK